MSSQSTYVMNLITQLEPTGLHSVVMNWVYTTPIQNSLTICYM